MLSSAGHPPYRVVSLAETAGQLDPKRVVSFDPKRLVRLSRNARSGCPETAGQIRPKYAHPTGAALSEDRQPEQPERAPQLLQQRDDSVPFLSSTCGYGHGHRCYRAPIAGARTSPLNTRSITSRAWSAPREPGPRGAPAARCNSRAGRVAPEAGRGRRQSAAA